MEVAITITALPKYCLKRSSLPLSTPKKSGEEEEEEEVVVAVEVVLALVALKPCASYTGTGFNSKPSESGIVLEGKYPSAS